MRFKFILFVALVLLVASGAAVAPQRSEAANKVRIFVQLPDTVKSQDATDIQSLGGKARFFFPRSRTLSLEIPESLLPLLSRFPRFSAIRRVPLMQSVEDTLPWGVDRINAEQVWGGAENAVNVASGRNDGSGVTVAVLDSGIGPNSDVTVAGGTSFVSGVSSYNDDNGHGTHVAGIIAARDNGFGVIGVAPGASLLSVKVLDSTGSGYMDDVAAGVNWAVSHGADVINMSLGCYTTPVSACDDPVLGDAVSNAAANNVVVVAAAGNSCNAFCTTSTDNVGYPARYPDVIAVGAICGTTVTTYCSSADSIALFSSRGPDVEVAAPGDYIYSTYGSGYAYLSGTSMASPHVAGLAALVVACGYHGAAARSRIDGTAQDLGSPVRDSLYGYGVATRPPRRPVPAAAVAPRRRPPRPAQSATSRRTGNRIAGPAVPVGWARPGPRPAAP